jgi:hypothetical protein
MEEDGERDDEKNEKIEMKGKENKKKEIEL